MLQRGVTWRDGIREERQADGPKLHLPLQSPQHYFAPLVLLRTRGAGKQPPIPVQGQNIPSPRVTGTTGSSQGPEDAPPT